jgi:hypothetical protein
MSLALIDERFFTIFILKTFIYFLLYIDPRIMKQPPLDAPDYDESNELLFIRLQSLDAEIMRFKFFKKDPSEYFL